MDPFVLLVILSPLLILASAVMNKVRGGWGEFNALLPFRLPYRFTASFFICLPLFFMYETWYYGLALVVGMALVTWAAGFSYGWGSYFTIGRNPHSWGDDYEVPFIDKLLYKVFGPVWRPSNYKDLTTPDRIHNAETRYDVVESPTGEVRPMSWRFRRDLTGMTLRGWMFSIPWGIILALLFWNPWFLLLVPVGLLMGPIYALSWVTPDFHFILSKMRTGPEIGEVFWGGFCAAVMVVTALLYLA